MKKPETKEEWQKFLRERSQLLNEVREQQLRELTDDNARRIL